MKIRKGFVSNSSSSSFVLIGQRVTKKSKLIDVIENTKNKIYATGEWFESGVDLVELTTEMFDFMVTSGIVNEFTFYETFADGCESITINRDNLPEGNLEILSLEVDDHSCRNIEDLKECYINYRN